MSRDSVDPLVEQIERDAARQAKAARAVHSDDMKALRTEFKKNERAIAAKERDELKRIERWRVAAVAAVEGRPVPLGDVRSVKRDDVVTDARGVSLPKLRCVS